MNNLRPRIKQKHLFFATLRLCIFALCILVFLSLPRTLSAQTGSDWQVAVFEDGGSAVKVLTAQGVSLTIPSGSLVLHKGSFPNAPLVALSDNRSALAVLNFTPGGRLTVSIAANGSCCKTVRLADEGVMVAHLGGFSPNGRRFAVSYLIVTDESARQFEAAVVTVDVELGAVVDRLDDARIGGDFAWLTDWNSDGIGFVPFCYGCDQPPAGSISRWNPLTDTITSDTGQINALRDTLALTGETLATQNRPDYPLPPQEDVANVVTFDGRVIYYNPRSLQVIGAHWVADGWQVLVDHPDTATLIDRAGVQRSLPGGEQFLVGTPDGWLSTRDSARGGVEVVHRTLTNLDGTVLARFNQPVTVLQAPPLGATASRGGFPDVPSPVSRITCPDTLPPRLFAGGKGRVSGGGVYLRREPSLSGEQRFMVTDQVFDVISGPRCDPTGIAWWEVGIGGLRGWMAESKDGVYLLEPVFN